MSVKGVIKNIIKILPSSLKDKISRLLVKKLRNYKKEWLNTEWSLMNLKKNGFSPAVIIDGGAYVGNWTRMIKKVFPEATVLMIEANPEKEKYLQQLKSEHPKTTDYAVALLAAKSRVSTEFYQMETGSSVFEEHSNILRKVIRLSTKTLDEIVHEKNLTEVGLIKLDVQGAEIEVLKGGIETLRKAQVVLLEVSFLQYNKAAPLASEVVSFMDNHGFVIYDIGTTLRWSTDNILLQADLFFIKKSSALRPSFFEFPMDKKN